MSVLHSLLPVFCLVALGCIMGRRFDPGPFSRLALLVTSPALIFVLIHDTRPAASDWLLLGGSALAIMCCCGLVTHLVLRAKLLPGVGRGLYLPAMFWNAGNLGLSVLERSDGLAGKAAGSLVFVTILSAQAVFGTWIAKGRGGGRELLRMPLVHAAVAGMVAVALGLTLPDLLMDPIRMVSQITIPLLLLVLGMQLRRIRVQSLRGAFAAVLLRQGVALVAASALVAMLGLNGLERRVLLVEAALPPAVISLAISRRYESDPDLVASAILLGTLVSAVLLPFVLTL